MSRRRKQRCEYCTSGDSHQCQFYSEYGITGLPGGLAEYIAVPAVNVVPITSDVDPISAAIIEPTLVAAIGASGGFRPDRRPLIHDHAIHLVESRKIDTASWVTHRYHSLEAVPQAFISDHRNDDYIKGVAVLSAHH